MSHHVILLPNDTITTTEVMVHAPIHEVNTLRYEIYVNAEVKPGLIDICPKASSPPHKWSDHLRYSLSCGKQDATTKHSPTQPHDRPSPESFQTTLIPDS